MSGCWDCAVCRFGDHGCLAGMNDDDYVPATKEQVSDRLKNNRFESHRNRMIEYLNNGESEVWEIKENNNGIRL